MAPVWAAPSTSVAGSNPSDSGFIIWNLRWVSYALSHSQIPFLTSHIYWPAGVNLMWNVEMPLAGLLLWPVTALLGPVFAYNLLVTLAFALSAWTAYLAARRFIDHQVAAILAGLVYGFSPYMVAQAQGHLYLTVAFVPPLMLLLFDEILIRQRRSPLLMGGVLALAATVQFFLAEELLASEALVIGLAIFLLINLFPQQVQPRWRHALLAVATAGTAVLLVVAVPLAIQFFGPQHLTHPIQFRNAYVSDLLGFVVPTAQLQFAPAAAQALSERFSGYPAEWDAYLGLPLLGVVAITAVRFWRLPFVGIAVRMFLLVVVLSLGPTLHVAGIVTWFPIGALAVTAPLLARVFPYRVILIGFPLAWAAMAAAPVLSNLLPARLMLYALLAAGLLLAVFAAATLQWRRTAIVPAALIGASLICLMPRLPMPVQTIEIPSFFTGTEVKTIPEGSVAFVLPYARVAQSTAMVWQASANMRFRMPEAYAILPGPSFAAPVTVTSDIVTSIEVGQQAPVLTDAIRAQVRADLRHWNA